MAIAELKAYIFCFPSVYFGHDIFFIKIEEDFLFFKLWTKQKENVSWK